MTVLIAGVGMIPFAKPGASAPYDEMGEAAIRLALKRSPASISTRWNRLMPAMSTETVPAASG